LQPASHDAATAPTVLLRARSG